jgi:hypothetical protein
MARFAHSPVGSGAWPVVLAACAGFGLLSEGCGIVSSNCAEIETCLPDDATVGPETPPGNVDGSMAEADADGSGEGQAGSDEGVRTDARGSDSAGPDADAGLVDGSLPEVSVDGTLPDGASPDATLPDGAHPDATGPDSAPLDATVPDATDAADEALDSGGDSANSGPEGGDAALLDGCSRDPSNPCDSGFCCLDGCCPAGSVCCITIQTSCPASCNGCGGTCFSN